MEQQVSVHKSDFINGAEWSDYSLLARIGKGSFGCVFQAKHVISSSVFAIKCVPKRQITDASRMMLEINVLKQADHPQIIRIYHVFEDSANVNIVMELCEGGELLKHFVPRTEAEAATIVKQVLNAVNYLHSHNICHRDLKPENVLFASKGDIESLKIIDFGLAKVTSPLVGMKTRAGSPYYVSPDVLKGNYGLKCDLWSVGVIVYQLLSGCTPFTGHDQRELFSNIARGEYSFPANPWDQISGSAKDLISRLLVVDPEQRLSAQEALGHPWLSGEAPNLTLQPVMEPLSCFLRTRNLHKAARLAVASFCTESDISHLKAKFQALDTNHDGSISATEFAQGLDNMSPDDVEGIVRCLDQDGNGVVNYSEFVAATLDEVVLKQDDKLWDAFISFDRSRSGRITAETLQQVLSAHSDEPLDSVTTARLLQEADANGDGVVDFYEFAGMLRGQSTPDVLPSNP